VVPHDEVLNSGSNLSRSTCCTPVASVSAAFAKVVSAGGNPVSTTRPATPASANSAAAISPVVERPRAASVACSDCSSSATP
jgi:hypothetical protein